MKKIIKFLLATAVAVIGVACPAGAQTYDFEVDGIYYKITSGASVSVAPTCEIIKDTDGNVSTGTCWGYYQGDIVIPQSANGYEVTGIGDFAFYQASINSIDLPENLKTIGERAFCSSY